MKGLAIGIVTCALATCTVTAFADDVLVLKDFEGKYVTNERALRLEGSDKDYCNAYSGPNSESDVEVLKEKGAVGIQALHIYWDRSDWAGVEFDVASRFTEDYSKFRITYKGSGNGYKWRIQFWDNGNEQHEFVMEDDSETWKTVDLVIAEAVVRTDWQPEDKDGNETLDYPIKKVNLESYDSGELDLYVDQFEAVK